MRVFLFLVAFTAWISASTDSETITCEICTSGEIANPSAVAGYDNGNPYTCADVQAFIATPEGQQDVSCADAQVYWSETCCGVTCEICTNSEINNPSAVAGYDNGNPYTCADVQAFMDTPEGQQDVSCADAHVYWSETCCGGDDDSDATIRLVTNNDGFIAVTGGTKGILQIKTERGWMYVCKDGYFDQNSNGPNVACRELLGLTSGFVSSARADPEALFVDAVMCSGTETKLIQCQRSKNESGECYPIDALNLECVGHPADNALSGEVAIADHHHHHHHHDRKK